MARDLNKVMLTGRLGRDPELRYTQSGDAVATFSVASDRSVKDESEPSGWRQQTEWFRVVAWRSLAERSAKNLTKGMRVYVEGRIQTQEYTDKQGQKQRSTEVIADDFISLESRNQQNAANRSEEGDALDAFDRAPAGRSNGASNRTSRTPSRGGYEEETLETEDIPF